MFPTIEIDVGQTKTFSLKATYKNIQAPLRKPVRWSSSNKNIATVEPSEDGMSCSVTAVANELGSCVIYADSGNLQTGYIVTVSAYADNLEIVIDQPA